MQERLVFGSEPLSSLFFALKKDYLSSNTQIFLIKEGAREGYMAFLKST